MAEWLPQITAETSYQEMLERPSAFNPHPKLVDRQMEMSTLGVDMGETNFYHQIRYSNGDIYDVQWPIRKSVPEPVEREDLFGGNEHIRPDSGLTRFDDFWEKEASDLIKSYMFERGAAPAQRVYRQARNAGLSVSPSNFVHYAILQYEHSLKQERPAVAYVIAQTALAGSVDIGDNQSMQPRMLRHWLTDMFGNVLEPGVNQLVRNAQRNRARPREAGVEELRHNMAMIAIDLVRCDLMLRPLHMMDEQIRDSKPAIAEKIVQHQIATGRQALRATSKLADTIDAVPDNIRDSTALNVVKQKPRDVSRYLLETIRWPSI